MRLYGKKDTARMGGMLSAVGENLARHTSRMMSLPWLDSCNAFDKAGWG